MPCLMRWPGKIPAAKTCYELCSTIDFYQRCGSGGHECRLANRAIDGRDTVFWFQRGVVEIAARLASDFFIIAWNSCKRCVRARGNFICL